MTLLPFFSREQKDTGGLTDFPLKKGVYLLPTNNKQYDANIEKQAELVRKMYHIDGVKNLISNETLDAEYQKEEKDMIKKAKNALTFLKENTEQVKYDVLFPLDDSSFGVIVNVSSILYNPFTYPLK